MSARKIEHSMKYLKEYDDHEILKDLDELEFMHHYEIYIKLAYYYPNESEHGFAGDMFDYVFPVIVELQCSLEDKKENYDKLKELAFLKARREFTQEEIEGDLKELYGQKIINVFSKEHVEDTIEQCDSLDEVAQELGEEGYAVIDGEANHPGSTQGFEKEIIIRKIHNKKIPRKK